MQHFLVWSLPGCKWRFLDLHSGGYHYFFDAVAIAGVAAVVNDFTVFVFVAIFDAFVIDVFFSQQCIILVIFCL